MTIYYLYAVTWCIIGLSHSNDFYNEYYNFKGFAIRPINQKVGFVVLITIIIILGPLSSIIKRY